MSERTFQKLTVVIPVYNEVETVKLIVDAVQAVEVPLEKEILLVDDCSKDGTRELYPEIREAHPNVTVILHEENTGKGGALRTGFAEATGDIVLVQDADLEYDPQEYPVLIDPILKGRADVVLGSRFQGGGPHRVVYYWHYLGNKFLTLVSNMMTNLNLTDMECCYKVFRKEVLQNIQIKEPAFGVEPEITAKVAKGKWRIYEVPVAYYGRTYEEGKKITWRDGFSALRCILKYRFTD